jgi:hypothetical protein
MHAYHNTYTRSNTYIDLHWSKWLVILILLNWYWWVLYARYQKPYLHRDLQ